jgi:DNA-binding beta-propeller fold protein YncE
VTFAAILRSAIAALAVALILGAASASVTRTTSGAGITVSAEPIRGADDGAIAFRIMLDTHAGDLMQYALVDLATIETGDGTIVTGPFVWEAASDTSHHREGVLRLTIPAPDSWETASLRLVLRDIGVAERVFEWAPAEEASGAAGTLGRTIYVPVIADGAIAAIDTVTLELAWTLVVSEGSDERGPEAAMGIAASPDGRLVYAGDATTRELVVVDAGRREIVARVGLDHGIHAIDLAPDGRTLWVDGGLDGYPWLSATSVIDTETLGVVRTLVPALGSASHLAFTPDGREVWAPSVSSNLVWVWEADSGEVLAAIALTTAPLAGDSPEAARGQLGFNEIAISPDGTRAYAVGPEAAIVYAIDVAARRVLGSVPAGERAHGIAVSPDGREVWTANRSGSVSVIDALTLEPLATLDMGAYANHVSFSRDGTVAYVSRETDVAVVDVATRGIVREIPVGRAPHEFTREPHEPASGAAAGD